MGLEVPREGRGGQGRSGLAKLHLAVPALISFELLVHPPSKYVWSACMVRGHSHEQNKIPVPVCTRPVGGGLAGETTTSLGWLMVSLSCSAHSSPSSGMKPQWGGDPPSS